MTKPPENFDFHQFNKYKLDEEWENQPKYYRYYAEQVAEAEYNHSRLTTELELVEAEAELAVRKNPEAFGVEKITESVVKALVTTDTKVRQARHKVIAAKHDVDIAKAAVRTLDHRKSSLEGATQLFLANYFSRPHLKGDAGKVMGSAAADRAFGKKKQEG